MTVSCGSAIDGRQFAAQPVEGDGHAQELVPIAMDRHADVVQRQTEQHHDAGVVGGHRVVGDAVGLDAGFDEQAQQRVAVVHGSADVYRAVVVDRRAAGGAIGHVPQGLNLDVGFQQLEDLGST